MIVFPRLKRKGEGPESSAGWRKRVALYGNETVGSEDNPHDGSPEQVPEASSPHTSHSKAFEAVNAFLCGKEDSLNLLETKELAHIKQVVKKCSTIDKAISRVIQYLRKLRQSEGRQKTKCVVLVPHKKHFTNMMSTINTGIVQTKKRSKFGCSSGKNSDYSFVGYRMLADEKLNGSGKINKEVINHFQSGKAHTIFCTDSTLHVLKPFASRVGIFIQLSKYPSIELYAERMSVLTSLQDSNENQQKKDQLVKCYFYGAR